MPLREANLLIDGGNIVCRITSLERSPTLGRTIGFALADPKLTTTGTVLTIRASDGRLVNGRVFRPPFVEGA